MLASGGDRTGRGGSSEAERVEDDQVRAPKNPAAGIVRTQANRIRRATPQRTPRRPRLAPTPMIALEMTWVVESGMPKWAPV